MKNATKISFLILFLICPMIVIGQPSEQKNFEIYESFGYSGMPIEELRKSGLKNIKLYGHGHLWKKLDAYRPAPNLDEVKSRARQSILDKDSLVTLDIEMWPISNTSNEEAKQSIERFKQVAKAFRTSAPGIRFGFYGEIPQRNYWDPVRHEKGLANKAANWQQTNQKLQEIADLVDVIMPSLYTFYDDPDGWKIYARANLLEARKYGKPVYAYLWPQISEENIYSAKYASYSFWKIQLETVYQYADGVVIWTPKGIGQKWDENAEWWRATKDFIREKKLGIPPTAPSNISGQQANSPK